ncbi:IQ calmodulin-binding motif-containing protein 1 [Protopterus annectens]|uniref:IQ calmodulin-binding motif-containing protein 1 n=1 Tax=Protopterus annectens TaxID=7888 RepID=UPI001CFBFDCF|nr:IQ calmodulin-binding motif-containing protein 1 [Protopterus annectens]
MDSARDEIQEDTDPQILFVAAEIAESSDLNIPSSLLKLKQILEGVPSGSKELKKLKQDIYRYDLLQYCVVILKQDFSRINGGWATATQLGQLLSDCCLGLEPNVDSDEFYNNVLPAAVDNLLFLARRLQARFIRAIKDCEKMEFLHHFRTVTDSLCWLIGGHFMLAQHVLRSDHFLQLIITDDIETGTVMMSALQNIIRVNSSIFTNLDEKTICSILDELVYKLSSTSNPVIGSTATKLLLLMAESHPPVVQILCTSYKGIHIILSKQWTGRGFGRELTRLLELLSTRSSQQEEMQNFFQICSFIQLAWRWFSTSKKTRKLPSAPTPLQTSFRAKREQELQVLGRKKEEEELRQQLQLRRHRAMREFRERQLLMLEIVPASQIGRHLQDMEQKSAVMIQKHWRGHRERRNYHKTKQTLREFKAAVTVQRAVLKFLERRRKLRKVFSPLREPKGLSDVRRLELLQKVEQHIKLHPKSSMSDEGSTELHMKCQEKLGQYLMRRNLQQKDDQRREALLAQINTDIELLSNAPGLKEVTEKELDLFTSRSLPVAARAKQSHNTMLQFTRWPWWKKLGDEFIDPEAIPSQEIDMDFESLYIGGSKTT